MFYWTISNSFFVVRCACKGLLLFIIVSGLYSCDRNYTRTKDLFAIDSLLRGQVQHLAHHNASIAKVTTLGNKNNIVTLKPGDTIAWRKELEIFEALNVINKPVNKQRYRVEFHSDIKSNLKVKSFITSDDLSVKYLKIYYEHLPTQMKKIEASYDESNALYHSAKVLLLEFEQIRDTSVLTTYSVRGGQKMFLDDTVQYNIKGTLTLGH